METAEEYRKGMLALQVRQGLALAGLIDTKEDRTAQTAMEKLFTSLQAYFGFSEDVSMEVLRTTGEDVVSYHEAQDPIGQANKSMELVKLGAKHKDLLSEEERVGAYRVVALWFDILRAVLHQIEQMQGMNLVAAAAAITSFAVYLGCVDKGEDVLNKASEALEEAASLEFDEDDLNEDYMTKIDGVIAKAIEAGSFYRSLNGQSNTRSE